MNAPDRPTHEQVDEVLERANTDCSASDVDVLAAEVRALRAELDAAVREHDRHAAELERVHDCLRHESDAHIAERTRLRVKLAERDDLTRRAAHLWADAWKHRHDTADDQQAERGDQLEDALDALAAAHGIEVTR